MKKVLISLDELNSIRECGNIKGWNCKEWFDAQPEAPQWVRVEDGLPDIGKPVFLRDKDNYTFVGLRDIVDLWVNIAIEGHYLQDITHWMPIPPLPEVGE